MLHTISITARAVPCILESDHDRACIWKHPRVSQLLESYENATQIRNTRGFTPLQSALELNSPTEVVLELLRRFPAAAKMANHDRIAPLLTVQYALELRFASRFLLQPQLSLEFNVVVLLFS